MKPIHWQCPQLCGHGKRTGPLKAAMPAHRGTAKSMAPFMGLPTPPSSPALQRYMAGYPYMWLSVESHGMGAVCGKYLSFCKFMESKYCSSPPS